MSRLRPFFSYYGSKWMIAPRYPAPLHDHIVEPFAGSAQYSTLHWRRRVTLIEKNPVVAAVWRWLIAADAREVMSIPLIADGQTVDDLGLCQEAAWFVGFWLNKAATAPGRKLSKWVRSTAHDARYKGVAWGEHTRACVARQVHACDHWQIVEGDYRCAPMTSRACYFIDPPYAGKAGSHYQHGSQALDYGALSSWCRQIKGQAIVCEADGAQWLPFEPFAVSKSSQVRHGRVSREAVWTKGCVMQGSLFDE